MKSNAVAFISQERTGYSLWIANVDGSGEKKLTDIVDNEEWISNHLLQWSPDGKWIGYISGNDLWVVSPDGSINKKILSRQDANKKIIRRYVWSPDSTKIAYTLARNWEDFTELKTRLLDLTTGKDSEISVYQSPTNIILSWSPDGRYILLNTEDSLKIFEVSTGKVRKEIRSTCPILHGEPSWSPNSEWFYRFDGGVGYYYIWVCMNGVNGESWQAIDGVISQPVWDKTGDYLYFVVGEMNLDIGPNWFVNQRLVRYDVSTRKIEDLLSLEEDGPTGYPRIVSLSPNGQMLGLYSYTIRQDDKSSTVQNKFIILDIESLSMTKYSLGPLGEIKRPLPSPMWSYDSKNIIFSDYDSFYSLDIATGKVSLFSGVHAIEKAIISPFATTP